MKRPRTIVRLRDEGHVVLLHCAATQSRTPAVAMRYSMLRGVPLDQAMADVRRVLPGSAPRGHLVEALRSFEASA